MQYGTKIRITIALMSVMAASAMAQSLYREPKPMEPMGKPQSILNVGIDQRLDQQLPLDLPFRDETGKSVRLGDYFGSKPVVLTLVYYTCPMLCSQVEHGIAGTYKVLKFTPGHEFETVSVSINPNETPQDAMKAKQDFLRTYGRPGSETGLHFLVGDHAAITELAKATGYRYNYDAASGQYAHATAIMVATPQGRLAQYFYGIEYSPTDLRLALVEAAQQKIGTVVDAVLLYCFHYDPSTARYSAVILNIVRVAGLATVFAVGMFLMISFRHEAKEKLFVTRARH